MIAACTKIEQPLLQPNTIKEDDEVVTDKELLRIIERLEKNDIHTKRLKSVIASYRKPHWNKSLFKYKTTVTQARGTQSGNGADTIVYVPLSPPRQAEVKAYIKAVIQDSISLSLYMASDYKKYPYQDSTHNQQGTSEKMAMRFMDLNESVYGYTRFKILDSNLFRTYYYKNSIRTDEVRKKSTTSSKKQYVEACINTYGPVLNCPWPGNCGGTGGSCDVFQGCPSCFFSWGVTGEACLGGWFEIEPPGGSSGGPVGAPPAGTTGGGGGSGGADPTEPAGWEPMPTEPTDPHEPPQDPCEAALIQSARLDSIWENSPIDSALNTIPPGNINKYEYGFNIIKKFETNPNGPPFYHNPTIITGPVVTQNNSSGVTVPAPTTNPVSIKRIGFLHTHPDSSVSAPSATDLYNFCEMYADDPRNVTANFVVGSDGTKYAITISNPALAAQFFSGKNDNLDTTYNRFKVGSELGKKFQNAEEFFKKKFEGQSNQSGKAFEMATAAVLSMENSGITLNKQNSNGKFVPIILKAEPNPKKRNQIVYSNACN